MNSYFIVDAHCDTVLKMDELQLGLDAHVFDFNLHDAMNFGGYLQIFATWVDMKKYKRSAFERADGLLKLLKSELDRVGARPYKSGTDKSVPYNADTGGAEPRTYKVELQNSGGQTPPLQSNFQLPISTLKSVSSLQYILSLEGCDALEGKIENLQHFYDMGVRCVSLTWNQKNAFASGALSVSKKGLTEEGRELIKELNRLRILIDVSHLSETAFWDVIELSTAPVIASHSNSAAVCKHKRNLTDEQFKALAQKGGVAGLNFYGRFLTKHKKPTVDDIIAHFEHFLSISGENAVGIGSDFDGASNYPPEVSHNAGIATLIEELEKKGYNQETVAKFAGGNFLRVLNAVLI